MRRKPELPWRDRDFESFLLADARYRVTLWPMPVGDRFLPQFSPGDRVPDYFPPACLTLDEAKLAAEEQYQKQRGKHGR